jgi:hypothetical protein
VDGTALRSVCSSGLASARAPLSLIICRRNQKGLHVLLPPALWGSTVWQSTMLCVGWLRFVLRWRAVISDPECAVDSVITVCVVPSAVTAVVHVEQVA